MNNDNKVETAIAGLNCSASYATVRREKEKRFFKVEKILKKKNGMALVKWQGYDDDKRSWIPLKDIKEDVSKK